ncbi:MAG: FecCD family ABC transporter permease, partial [Planctomycetota bacterium]
MHTFKPWIIYTFLVAVLAGACFLSLFAGAVRIPLDEMFESGIIRLRVARILLAVVVGAGLSVAGAVFQAMLRNPLAEPYILGVSSGAGLGAASAIVLGIGAMSVWSVPAMAFIGSVLTILIVYRLASEPNGVVPVYTLLLAGVIVNAALSSVLMFIVSSSSSNELHNVVWWLLGNLQIFDWRLLQLVSLVILSCLFIVGMMSHKLNIITLGEEPASHLGLNVEATKKIFFLLASLMTASAVAACGLIGFVGLIIPHCVRLAIGPDHRRLVIASALAGAVFLVLADSFARTVIAPTEIPIGVVTTFI